MEVIREPYHVHFWGNFCGETTEARKWIVAVISGAKVMQALFVNKGLTIFRVRDEELHEFLYWN